MSKSITVRAPAPMGTRVRCLRDDRFQREVQVAPFEVRIETKRRGPASQPVGDLPAGGRAEPFSFGLE